MKYFGFKHYVVSYSTYLSNFHLYTIDILVLSLTDSSIEIRSDAVLSVKIHCLDLIDVEVLSGCRGR